MGLAARQRLDVTKKLIKTIKRGEITGSRRRPGNVASSL
jgi:hypothetical protein